MAIASKAALVVIAALAISSPATAQLAYGPGPGSPPLVGGPLGSTCDYCSYFGAYGYDFLGGVHVAVGDVNGDGVLDLITGAGPGGGPHIKVFSGTWDRRLLASFYAFDPSFRGGVFVAAGDFNGDGVTDIIAGAGPGGGPHVVVFNGVDLSYLASFYAYDQSFRGGVTVASGDVNGDGFDDILTGAGPGAAPHVTVRSGPYLTYLASFYAYDPAFRGGVFVAAGDIDRDGLADIITGAGPGGGPHVIVRSGRTLSYLASFYAYDPAFRGGVSVAAGDENLDGVIDIITGAGPGGGPHVLVFDGRNLSYLRSYYGYDPSFTGGVWVGSYAGLRITTTDAARTFEMGNQQSFMFQGTGSLSVVGSLPSGIQTIQQGNGSLLLTGRAASGTGGVYPLTVTATSGNMKPATKPFTLTVHEYPSFTSGNPPPFRVGTFGSFTLTTAGYPAATVINQWISLLPVDHPDHGVLLPPGLTLVDRGDGTALVQGIPAPGTAGTCVVWFETYAYNPVSRHWDWQVTNITLTILP
ncbi:MAG: VCBS repeat-containing protein [Vicinamibacterales bacterium]|nr:VCBS repeat-containing protein [Vicinamibacterales bacterium]